MPRQTAKYTQALATARGLKLIKPSASPEHATLYNLLTEQGYGWDGEGWQAGAASPVAQHRAAGGDQDDVIRIRLMGHVDKLPLLVQAFQSTAPYGWRLIETSGVYPNRKEPLDHGRVYLTFLSEDEE